eukprot:436057-Hanusia_phi.AAC.2
MIGLGIRSDDRTPAGRIPGRELGGRALVIEASRVPLNHRGFFEYPIRLSDLCMFRSSSTFKFRASEPRTVRVSV